MQWLRMLWGGRRTCRSVCDNMRIVSELHAMWTGSIQTLHLGPSIHKLLDFFMFSWQDYSITPTYKHQHVCVCRYIRSSFILWLHQIVCSVKLCQLVNLLTVNHTFVWFSFSIWEEKEQSMRDNGLKKGISMFSCRENNSLSFCPRLQVGP